MVNLTVIGAQPVLSLSCHLINSVEAPTNHMLVGHSAHCHTVYLLLSSHKEHTVQNNNGEMLTPGSETILGSTLIKSLKICSNNNMKNTSDDI